MRLLDNGKIPQKYLLKTVAKEATWLAEGPTLRARCDKKINILQIASYRHPSESYFCAHLARQKARLMEF